MQSPFKKIHDELTPARGCRRGIPGGCGTEPGEKRMHTANVDRQRSVYGMWKFDVIGRPCRTNISAAANAGRRLRIRCGVSRHRGGLLSVLPPLCGQRHESRSKRQKGCPSLDRCPVLLLDREHGDSMMPVKCPVTPPEPQAFGPAICDRS